MRIDAIKRWQWLVIGLLVGLVWWGAHRWGEGGGLPEGAEVLNDRGKFEWALVTEVAGRRLFKDVSVHRQHLSDGSGDGGRDVYVVTGRYCAGKPDPVDNQYHWRPAAFVAPIPYRPAYSARAFDRTNSASSQDVLARYEQLETPTVTDFLDVLSAIRGVSYSNAWWDSYPALARIGGAVLLIGGVWPTIVNLLVFGRFTRPPEERATVSLGDVSIADLSSPNPMMPTDEDVEQLARVEAALEASLAEGAAPWSADETVVAEPAAPRVLVIAPVEAAAAAAAEDEKHFGAKADDYYPTDRKAHPHPSTSHGAANDDRHA